MNILRKIASGMVFVIFVLWIAFFIYNGVSGEYGKGIKGRESLAADIFWLVIFGGLLWHLATKKG